MLKFDTIAVIVLAILIVGYAVHSMRAQLSFRLYLWRREREYREKLKWARSNKRPQLMKQDWTKYNENDVIA